MFGTTSMVALSREELEETIGTKPKEVEDNSQMRLPKIMAQNATFNLILKLATNTTNQEVNTRTFCTCTLLVHEKEDVRILAW